HVTAKDLGTGKEQQITITASSGLSDSEIERMVNEAKAHEAEDKSAKDKIETKNHADSMVYQLEKQIKELGDKVPADVKSQLDGKIAALKDAIKADDTEAMKAKMKDLEETAMKMGEAVYAAQQQAQAGAGAPPPPQGGAAGNGGSKPDDGVVDAEVVE
ncbi:MAG: Hsp70 family protein, partial [Lentisphaeria bacterium]|nr:Hsp70 family protein [Lentisphaeria bacterium]